MYEAFDSRYNSLGYPMSQLDSLFVRVAPNVRENSFIFMCKILTRDDFKVIYLDNSATTRPYQDVLNAFVTINEQYYANPASIHEKGVEANQLLTRAREQIGEVLHTKGEHIIFTSGGTESNNLAIFGLTEQHQHIGKHIITTAIEHPSVLNPIAKLAEQGYEVTYLAVNKEGQISLKALQQALRKDTVLVSIMHVNNEMGAIQPIQAIARLVKTQSRAFLHVDAIQSFGKLPISFQDGMDVMTVSGHKIHALKGTGILAFANRPLLVPQLLGGGQEHGLRSGTVAVAQNVVLAKAMRIAKREQAMNEMKYRKYQHQLMEVLGCFQDVQLISTKQCAPHIITFSIKELRGEIIINALQKEGVIASTSSACSSKQQTESHVLQALKVDTAYRKGVVRLSLGSLLTDEEIQQACYKIKQVIASLKGE